MGGKRWKCLACDSEEYKVTDVDKSKKWRVWFECKKCGSINLVTKYGTRLIKRSYKDQG